MWWAIAGQAAATGAGIWSGIKKARELKKGIAKDKAENEAEYTRSFGTGRDALTGAARRALERGEEQLLSAERRNAAKARVVGMSDEAVAAGNEAVNQARADMYGNVVAQQQDKQEAARERYIARKQALNSQERQMQAQERADVATAIGNIAATAGKIGDAISTQKSVADKTKVE